MTFPWLWCAPRDSNTGDDRPRRAIITPSRDDPSGEDVEDTHRDGQLVDQVRAGDRTAFDAIYREYYTSLWRFAARLSGSGDTASDVLHEVFLAIWLRRAQWSPRGSIREYLFRAVRNEILQLFQHGRVVTRANERGFEAAGVAVAPDGGVGAPLEVADAEHALRAAVDTLPDRQREAFLLRWNDEMTPSQIGRVLGISATAATNLLAKAQARLQPLLRHFR